MKVNFSRYIKRLLLVNKFLLLLSSILFFIGLYYSYGIGQQLQRGFEFYWIKQLIWIIIGSIFLFLIISFSNLRIFKNFSIIFYLLGIFFLILVLFFGIEVNNARSWLNIFGLNFQVSEIAKITTLVFLSYFISKYDLDLNKISDFLKTLFIFLIPLVLVALQPDLGTGLVFCFIFLNSLILSNIRFKILFIFFLIGVLSSPFIYLFLKTHQQNRIDVFLHPITFPISLKYSTYLAEENELGEEFLSLLPNYRFPYRLVSLKIKKKKGLISEKKYLAEKKKIPTNHQFLLKESWQYYQSILAIGSGGLKGKGWQKGTQYSLGYIPLGISMTDCIFPVIAEEGGFFVLLFVLLLYFLFLTTIISIAYKARDEFGKVLCLNIVAMFLTHIMVNIGMSLGFVPIIGISLPFLSYGGSFAITTILALALVFLVDIDRGKTGLKLKL